MIEIMDFTMRLSCAIFFGILIGVERQLTGHSAGIRINVLVSMGACMFTLFPLVIGSEDIARIAAQVVSGVGFICSGIIFKDGLTVRGLNTAATIWCTAAIGVLVSSGQIIVGAVATMLLLTGNLLLRQLAKLVQPLECFTESEYSYLISIICSENREFEVRDHLLNILRASEFLTTNMESSDVIGDKVEIAATLLCRGKRQDNLAEDLVARIRAEQGIFAVGWKFMD